MLFTTIKFYKAVYIINRTNCLLLASMPTSAGYQPIHGTVHIKCITCTRDLPNMYTHALGPNGPRAWVYISGKSLVMDDTRNFKMIRYQIILMILILFDTILQSRVVKRMHLYFLEKRFVHNNTICQAHTPNNYNYNNQATTMR